MSSYSVDTEDVARRLKRRAIQQGSTLYCPNCGSNLPYKSGVVTRESHGRRGPSGDEDWEVVYHCAVCNSRFYLVDRET
jgi:DNA-directed RNA polymerase subunit RPC12/RpoP